jgi:hypothetical protein
LVNLNATEPRVVIVQAGAFGEHRFTRVRQDDEAVEVNGRFFQVRLQPAARGRLEIGMIRYAQRPTYVSDPVEFERKQNHGAAGPRPGSGVR